MNWCALLLGATSADGVHELGPLLDICDAQLLWKGYRGLDVVRRDNSSNEDMVRWRARGDAEGTGKRQRLVHSALDCEEYIRLNIVCELVLGDAGSTFGKACEKCGAGMDGPSGSVAYLFAPSQAVPRDGPSGLKSFSF